MDNSDEVCRSFRNNGKCRFGDDCKFVHSEGEPIQPPPRTGGRECFEFRDNGSCSHGDSCRFSHGEDDARFTGDVADEICKNFQRGRCKFGDDCRRKHVPRRSDDAGDKSERKPAAKKASGDANNTDQRRRRVRKPVDPETLAQEVCKNFLAGRCKFGDDCHRKHEGTPNPDAAPAVRTGAGAPRRRNDEGGEKKQRKPIKKIDEQCNNFKAGNCRLGERCRRQHSE